MKFKVKLIKTALRRYLFVQTLTLKDDLRSDRVLYTFSNSQINKVEKTNVLGKDSSGAVLGKVLQLGA